MYKVIESFEDLLDNRYAYHAGDIFPRKGVKVTIERITELSTDKNRRGKPLISEIPSITLDKPVKSVSNDVDVKTYVPQKNAAKTEQSGKPEGDKAVDKPKRTYKRKKA